MDKIDKLAVGMKHEVPRPGFLRDLGFRWLVRRQLSGLRVPLECQDHVGPQIGREHETVGWIGLYGVRVEAGRNHLRRRLRDALGVDRIDRDLVAAVGRTEQRLATAIGRKIGHAVSKGTIANMLQLAGFRIDGVADNREGLRTDPDEQDPLVRAHRHGRRRPGLLDANKWYYFHQRHAPGLRVHAEDMDLVAICVANIGERLSNRRPHRTQRSDLYHGNNSPDQTASHVRLPI